MYIKVDVISKIGENYIGYDESFRSPSDANIERNALK